MYEVSDEIQAVATSFGDRYMLEEALKAMNAMDNQKAREVVERTIFLHCVFLIKTNLGWYTLNGCVSAEAAQELDSVFEQAVKNFVPHMNTAVEALGSAPHKHLRGPIARDYVKFNAQTENENFDAAGENFDFTKTGVARL